MATRSPAHADLIERLEQIWPDNAPPPDALLEKAGSIEMTADLIDSKELKDRTVKPELKGRTFVIRDDVGRELIRFYRSVGTDARTVYPCV